MSYDARIVRGMLERHTLRELYPDIDWDTLPCEKAEASALLRTAQRFLKLNDFESASDYLHKGYDRYPIREIQQLAAALKAQARLRNPR